MQAKNLKIVTMERCCLGYLANEDKNNGMKIVARNVYG